MRAKGGDLSFDLDKGKLFADAVVICYLVELRNEAKGRVKRGCRIKATHGLSSV